MLNPSSALLSAGALALGLLAGCGPRARDSSSAGSGIVVELMSHRDGSFEIVERATGLAVGDRFTLGGIGFHITERWAHAEALRETANDNPAVNHAVEIRWSEPDGTAHSRWITGTADDAPPSGVNELDLDIRLCTPGSRMPDPDSAGLSGRVQFFRSGRRHDLPEPGGTVFPGWTLAATRACHRALVGEDGGIRESDDESFVNRLLEARIVSDGGTEERHILFLDHPDLTRGIHPAILPVERIRGDGASLARLVVRSPMSRSDTRHQARISPPAGDAPLRVSILRRGESRPDTTRVEELPAEFRLGDGRSFRLARHIDHARAVVRWRRTEPPDSGRREPALVVEHESAGAPEPLVLVRDTITPAAAGDQLLMLRFVGPETPAAPAAHPPANP